MSHNEDGTQQVLINVVVQEIGHLNKKEIEVFLIATLCKNKYIYINIYEILKNMKRQEILCFVVSSLYHSLYIIYICWMQNKLNQEQRLGKLSFCLQGGPEY